MVPRADRQQNEYLPASEERLAWLTGFTGSAGAAVVLADRAALFADGRYSVQAATQVDGKIFSVENDYEKGQPNPKTEGGILLKTAAQRFYDELVFNIILTPDYNEDHYNHFHCDLTPGSKPFGVRLMQDCRNG